METKKEFEKELGSIVDEVLEKENEKRINEEKRIETEDHLKFEEIYEWHKNAGMVIWMMKRYNCITPDDFSEHAKKKKEGYKTYQKKKTNDVFEAGISSGEQGSYAGMGYQQIRIAMEMPSIKVEVRKAAIKQAISTMYLADLLEQKIDEKRVKARDEMLNKIKNGLQKPENYCLAETIKQELAKYKE